MADIQNMDRTVLVWASVWLPGSQTFIRNQVRNHKNWNAATAGIKKAASPISDGSDFILYGDSIISKILRRLFHAFRYSRRLQAYLISANVKLIHAHFGPDASIMVPTAKRLGLPLVITVHGTDVTAAPNIPGWKGKIYRRRLREAFNYASSVIAISEYVRTAAIDAGAPIGRVEIQYNGVPLEALGNDECISAWSAKKWDLVFVGRLIDMKGPVDVLQAVSTLPADLRNCRIAIVGEGPLNQELKNLSDENGLNVDFLGHQSPDQVREILEASRILVNPSKISNEGSMEGFGMVYLEAARSGLPVVAYHGGGIPEAVSDGETGFLSPMGDVQSLSGHLEMLLRSESLCQSMGLQGRERVRGRFNLHRQIELLESTFESVIARSVR